MSDIAIKVENLSKQYHIGQLHKRHDTLRDALMAGLGRFRRNPQLQTQNKDDTIWALKDVSFEVKRGEVVGIIGRNGAGKSTLLKILSRITEPTLGRAEIHGRVGSLLEVGTGFHPELTGRENIYMSGTILGMKKTEIDRRFDEIVAFSSVEKFIDTPVKRYSSGMNVRLGFAVAAHLEPEILLVDEVLAVGDASFQKKCLGKMGNIAQQGRTVLFVSHNMPAIGNLCDRALLIQNGRLFSEGKANEVIDTYLSSSSPPELTHTVKFSQPKKQSPWVESVTILCNGTPSATMKMGETLSLEIRYRSSVQPVDQPSIGLLISSAQGDTIVNANNIYQPSEFFSPPTMQGTIACNLGMLPLMPNRYLVSIWLGASPSSSHQFLENMVALEVIEYDVWGRGRVPTPKISSLWWPTIFEIRAAD